MRILIADDDAMQRRILATSLAKAGHEIEMVSDGEAAWARLERGDVRMVISDWMMPGIDGTELIRRIRATAGQRYVYTLLLTALDRQDDLLRGLEAGADDYLTKPVDLRELTARVAIGERILRLEDDRLRSHERLAVMARYDGLTGLLNRQAIQERAEAEAHRAARLRRPWSIVLFDIDHFKNVNDTFGHLDGDLVLRAVAGVLIDQKRPYDWAGRWGGEEFLLLLPETSLSEAVGVAERIRGAVDGRQLAGPQDTPIHVTISAGVASAGTAARPHIDALLREADTALYEAKAGGRNRVVAAQPAPFLERQAG